MTASARPPKGPGPARGAPAVLGQDRPQEVGLGVRRPGDPAEEVVEAPPRPHLAQLRRRDAGDDDERVLPHPPLEEARHAVASIP